MMTQREKIKELDQLIIANELVEFYVPERLDVIIEEYRSVITGSDSGRSVNLSSWRSWKTQVQRDRKDREKTYYEN
jgi:hypothetical protein